MSLEEARSHIEPTRGSGKGETTAKGASNYLGNRKKAKHRIRRSYSTPTHNSAMPVIFLYFIAWTCSFKRDPIARTFAYPRSARHVVDNVTIGRQDSDEKQGVSMAGALKPRRGRELRKIGAENTKGRFL